MSCFGPQQQTYKPGEGWRDDRGVRYHAESTLSRCSSAQVRGLPPPPPSLSLFAGEESTTQRMDLPIPEWFEPTQTRKVTALSSAQVLKRCLYFTLAASKRASLCSLTPPARSSRVYRAPCGEGAEVGTSQRRRLAKADALDRPSSCAGRKEPAQLTPHRGAL